MADFTVEELTIPAALDGSPAALDFEGTVDARNATEAALVATDELAFTAAELLPGWQESPHERRRLLAARVEGRVVARGVYESPLEGDAANTAWLQVQVHPEFAGRGIGRALADGLEAMVRDEGREVMHVYAGSGPGTGPQIDAPTGFGAVPAGNREVRFLLARGFALEQVERGSRLALPVEPGLLAERRAAAESRADGYRVHLWAERAPASWREEMAMLTTRMSTDVPLGGLVEPEDVWSVDRWLEYEERGVQSPRTLLFAAVEHVATGGLVGFTELNVPPEPDRPASQGDTIVVKEHRGHRLGMLLKVANIQHLQGFSPSIPAVITFNAEENRYMLDVNEAVGFVPFTYEGAWQKKL